MSETVLVSKQAGPQRRRFAVAIERGITFGRGGVDYSNSAGPRWRDLLLDVYEPKNTDVSRLRPGLVMAFGGAFHRGTREDDRVLEAVASNTTVAEYCREFASRGYVCFSIDYRLVPEDPDPGRTTVVENPDSIPRSRVDVVRKMMGLPVASNEMLCRGIEAASDDFAAALRFVMAHCELWRIDPSRVAAGGFSAWNAVYGEGVAAAAIVSLSGTMHPRDFARHLGSGRSLAPLLLLRGEDDLDYVREQNPMAAAMCRAAGIRCVEAVVPSMGHFYPADATVALENGSPSCVEDVIAAFLESCIGGSNQAGSSRRISLSTL
jgi:acetyl esterase/lipase